MTVRRLGAIVVLVLGSAGICVAKAPKSSLGLSATEQATVDAYRVELQRAAGADLIVDLKDPSLEGRLAPPSNRRMREPEVPKDVRDMHGSGRVVLGGVVERDGRISNVKVLIPSIYPAFDREASAALEQAVYERDGTLDGKAVRVFSVVKLTYQ